MTTGSFNVEMANVLIDLLCAMVHLTVMMAVTKPGLIVKVSLCSLIHIILLDWKVLVVYFRIAVL